MQIYLLRHGIAEDTRAGQPDAERTLTNEGRKKLRETLRAAHAAGVSPSLILSSPYARAAETAEIAAGIFGYKRELLRTRVLEPGARTGDVWDEIRVHKSEEQLLLVGHEPLFSSLAAALLGTPGLRIEFKKGALLRVDIEQFGPQPRGVLKWMLVAKLAGGGRAA